MATNPVHLFSEAEYLAIERGAETRSEFLNGEIFAMSGGSFAHAQLKDDLLIAISARLGSGPCQALSSDLRVKVLATGLHTYPDVLVVCGSPQFAQADIKDTLVNPSLIAEVLSPSTESYDRGKKFYHYRQIPSLQHYLLVSQDKLLIEHFERGEDDAWTFRTFESMDDSIPIANLAIHAPVREIYRRVEL